MMISHTTPSVDALRLAAAASVDPRTAARAMREGPHVIRGSYTRERLERAMRELGVSPSSSESPPAP